MNMQSKKLITAALATMILVSAPTFSAYSNQAHAFELNITIGNSGNEESYESGEAQSAEDAFLNFGLNMMKNAVEKHKQKKGAEEAEIHAEELPEDGEIMISE